MQHTVAPVEHQTRSTSKADVLLCQVTGEKRVTHQDSQQWEESNDDWTGCCELNDCQPFD